MKVVKILNVVYLIENEEKVFKLKRIIYKAVFDVFNFTEKTDEFGCVKQQHT